MYIGSSKEPLVSIYCHPECSIRCFKMALQIIVVLVCVCVCVCVSLTAADTPPIDCDLPYTREELNLPDALPDIDFW